MTCTLHIYILHWGISLDRAIYGVCARLLDLPQYVQLPLENRLGTIAFHRLFTPTRKGGLGFTSSADNAEAAYLSSIVSIGKLIAFFTKSEADVARNRLVDAYPAAGFDVRLALQKHRSFFNNPLADRIHTAAGIFSSKPIPGQQSHLAALQQNFRVERVAKLQKDEGVLSREILTTQGISGTYGHQWLGALGNRSLEDDKFRELMRFLLGVPMHWHNATAANPLPSLKCPCDPSKVLSGKDAYMHSLVCEKITAKHRHDGVRDAIASSLTSLQAFVDKSNPTRAFQVETEPYLHQKRIWAPKNPAMVNMGTKGDIYVWPKALGHYPRQLLIDVVVTAPADGDKKIGDAAARGSRNKFTKYANDWSLLANDPAFLAFAMEPTGFVAKATEVKLKNLIREVLNVPIPTAQPNNNNDAQEETSPPIYRYFLNKLRDSVSVALARGTAGMLLSGRKTFRVVPV